LADLCADNKFEELRIANFRLYPQHYDLISAALGKTTTLKTLRLNRVGMANPCSVKLATGLKVNSSLTMIDLSSNNIEDEGVAALAESLKENSTLEHLRLWDNKKIGVAGFKALSEMLEINKRITNVDLPSMLDTEYTAKIRETMMEKKMAQAA
jgi:Ran GTPase-activating protein (RanGAP) involved in mRNA processing and transport